MAEKKLNGTVIVTYRCNARCSMCNRYKAPSKPEEEISIETIRKLPKMYFTGSISHLSTKKEEANISVKYESSYFSFDEFFTREINFDKRPLTDHKDLLVSPCDSKLTVYKIDEVQKAFDDTISNKILKAYIKIS